MSLSALFSNNFIDTVIGSITDPLHIVDSSFNLLWANHEEAAYIGRSCYTMFGYDSPCSNCPVIPVFRTGKVNIQEKQVTKHDGSQRIFEIRAYPIFDKNKEANMAFTIGRDITGRAKAQANTSIQLTNRQAEVLKLVAEGYTNIEIASSLSISPHTVKRHITNLFNTLGVNDRTQAAIIALKLGLL